jgi:hypothetical protein
LVGDVPDRRADGVNRYLCYRTRPEKNSLSVFEVARGVTLADRAETLVVDVKRTESLCNPADIGRSGIVDPAAHLRTYTIRQVPRSPRFDKRVGIGVVTELGALTVDLIKRDDLMVPSTKSLSGPVGPPGPNAGDRYKCYGVKATAAPPDQDVVMADQFNVQPAEDLRRRTRHPALFPGEQGRGRTSRTRWSP